MRTFGLLAALVLTLAACGTDNADDVAPTSSPTVSTDGPGDAGPLGFELISDGGVRGGPVLVTVRLTNQSEETVTVVLPVVTPNFVRFTVADEGGRQIPFDGEYPLLQPLDASGFAELTSGESAEYTFDLTSLYALDPGTFVVGAEYRNPAAASHEGEAALTFEAGMGVEADPISVEVSP